MTLKLIDPIVCPECRVELMLNLVQVSELLPAGCYTRYEAHRCCNMKVSIDVLVNVEMLQEPRSVPQADGF